MPEKDIHICPRCGKNIYTTTNQDCWSSASHLPFDTLLKIKQLFNNNCLCKECLNEVLKKNK